MTVRYTLPTVFLNDNANPVQRYIHALPVAGWERRFVAANVAASPGADAGPIVDLGGGNPLTGIDRPTMRLEGTNFYAEFDGVNDYINSAGDAVRKDRSIYTVQRIRELPVDRFYWIISANAILYVDSIGAVSVRVGSTNYPTSLTVQPGKWHVFYLAAYGEQVIAGVDGVYSNIPMPGFTGFTGVANVATTNTAPNDAPVDFQEWTLYPSAHTIAQRSATTTALRAVYGL